MTETSIRPVGVVIPKPDEPLLLPQITSKPMDYQVVDLTKEVVTEILLRGQVILANGTYSDKKQLNPRPFDMHLEREYADDMLDGLWKQTHEACAISPSGLIVDGQHRFRAAYLAFKENPDMPPIRVVICFNADPKTFREINKGKKRNTAQDFAIEGVGSAPLIASTVKLLFCYYATRTGSKKNAAEMRVSMIPNNWSRARFSSRRAEAFFEARRETPATKGRGIDSKVDFIKAVAKETSLSPSGLLSARFALIEAGNDPRAVDQFFAILLTGEELPYNNHPAKKLRDWAMRHAAFSGDARVKRDIATMAKGPLHFRLLVQTFNLSARGEELRGNISYDREGKVQPIIILKGVELPGPKAPRLNVIV